MPKRILKKIIQIILSVLRRVKWHLLRGSLPKKLNFLPSVCHSLSFRLGVWIYKKFSWPNFKKEAIFSSLSYHPEEGLISFFEVFETLKNISPDKNQVVNISTQAKDFMKAQEVLSLLVFKNNVRMISVDFQETEDKKENNRSKVQNPVLIESFTYNQVSSLPLSSYREANLFLKRVASCVTLLVINLPLDSKELLRILSFKELSKNIKVAVNNLTHLDREILSLSNIIDLDLCGFSIQEKIAICQNANFYFGAYDSLALGAFDSNSQGIIYVPEKSMNYFDNKSERFSLKSLENISQVSEDIKGFLNSTYVK